MGVSVANTYAAHHRAGGSPAGIRFHLHQQNIGINQQSPDISANEWTTLKQNLGSQAAFDSAMANTSAGTWYAAWSSYWQSEMYEGAKMLANGA